MRLRNNKKVSFDKLSHTYLCGDKVLIGVTSLMSKHGLSVNYSSIPQRVLQEAADRGTAIHNMLEDYDNGKSVANAKYVDELNAYRKLGLKVLKSEYLVSDNKMVASQIDKVLATDEENMVDLGDVKTTSTLHKDALAWQLGIYKFLFELQNPKIKVRNCYGIHVRGDKAKMELVTPVSEKRVQALFDAEAEGCIYLDIPEAHTSALAILGDMELGLVEETESYLSQLEEQVKVLKAQLEESRKVIYDAMMEADLTKIDGERGVYSLRKPTVRESFDSASFKKAYPDLYAQFIKTSEVKGSISYKLNQQ